MSINDNDNSYCVFLIVVAVVAITLILVLGINYHHNMAYKAELDVIRVKAGLPTSDLEARVIRIEKTLEHLSREFRPAP